MPEHVPTRDELRAMTGDGLSPRLRAERQAAFDRGMAAIEAKIRAEVLAGQPFALAGESAGSWIEGSPTHAPIPATEQPSTGSDSTDDGLIRAERLLREAQQHWPADSVAQIIGERQAARDRRTQRQHSAPGSYINLTPEERAKVAEEELVEGWTYWRNDVSLDGDDDAPARAHIDAIRAHTIGVVTAKPPTGWHHFGLHADGDVKLELWGDDVSLDGLPIWERTIPFSSNTRHEPDEPPHSPEPMSISDIMLLSGDEGHLPYIPMSAAEAREREDYHRREREKDAAASQEMYEAMGPDYDDGIYGRDTSRDGDADNRCGPGL